MIKANSMQTDPKGKIPPVDMVKIGFMCQALAGTMRAIWLVLVGDSITDDLRPKKAPINTKGVATQTHNRKRTKMVKKLTAVAAPAKLKNTLRQVNMMTKIPGRAVAVKIEFIFQFLASENL